MTGGNEPKKAFELIKQMGYRLRKPGKYIKATFMVHEETLIQFKDAAKESDYQLQEAITEAMDLWADSVRKKPNLP